MSERVQIMTAKCVYFTNRSLTQTIDILQQGRFLPVEDDNGHQSLLNPAAVVVVEGPKEER